MKPFSHESTGPINTVQVLAFVELMTLTQDAFFTVLENAAAKDYAYCRGKIIRLTFARCIVERCCLFDPGGGVSGAGRVSKIGKISRFYKILQIRFGGLVLGCIKSKFCKKICV